MTCPMAPMKPYRTRATRSRGRLAYLSVIDEATVPPTATAQAASGVTATAATLNGGVNPHGSATTVSFVYGTDPTLTTGTTTTAADAIGSGSSAVAVTAALTGLQPGTTYYDEVVATNAGGTATADGAVLVPTPSVYPTSPITSFTTLAPPIATTQAASGVTTTAAMLNGSVNPQGSAATVTFVYGTDPQLTTGTTTSAAEPIGGWTSAVAATAALTGLQPGTTYYDEVVATSAGGTTVGPILSFTTEGTTTTTSLTPSVSTSVYGQSVTFTAAVSQATSGFPTPTGTVQFQADGVNLGSAVTLVNGAATSNPISSLTAAGHTITAIYSGDPDDASSSGSTSLTVNQAPLTVMAASQSMTYGGTVPTPTYSITGFVNGDTSAVVSGNPILTPGATSSSPVGSYAISVTQGSLAAANYDFPNLVNGTLTVNQASTTTACAASVNPSVYGQSVTFTATVGVVAPGSGTPTGTVAFEEGTTTLNTETLGVSGTVSFTTSALAVGSATITAVYSGDSNFVTSTSSTTETVNHAGTTTDLLASPTTANAGQTVTLTATIAIVAPGSGTPTGSVQFFVGTTSLGTASLSGNTAILTTTALPVGTDSLTAQYSGDPSFTASTSSAVSVTINPAGIATTTTLKSSLNPSVYGQAVTLTATVAPSSGSGTPTGSVTFYDGSTVLGTATLSSKKASLQTSSLPTGRSRSRRFTAETPTTLPAPPRRSPKRSTRTRLRPS